MSRRPTFLLVAFVLLTLSPLPGPDRADASCVAPSLDRTAGPAPTLARGMPVTVSGTGFHDGCADTMSCPTGPGCRACVEDDPEAPREDVRLRLRQAGRTWELGRADADESTRVTWRVVVPGGARPGPARLLADGAEPLVVHLT